MTVQLKCFDTLKIECSASSLLSHSAQFVLFRQTFGMGLGGEDSSKLNMS